MNVLVIHGPNLNLLGKREPHIHGTVTMEEINNRLASLARELGTDISFFQSNHEGALIDFLQQDSSRAAHAVLPFIARDDQFHWDCSKLDQWGIVFDHATARGLYLHFKLEENEIDDDRRGDKSEPGRVPEALDGGKLGPERRLYCRELIARFGHALALNWNIGEENTQSTEEVRDMVKFLHDTDPYRHDIVIHTFPGQQDKVYTPLLGDQSLLTGTSLQNGWNQTHQRTLKWVTESAKAGKPVSDSPEFFSTIGHFCFDEANTV